MPKTRLPGRQAAWLGRGMDRSRRDAVHELLGQTLAVDPRLRVDAVRSLSSALGRTAEHGTRGSGPADPGASAVVDEVWDRVLELAADPDRAVRRTVLHALANEAPEDRAGEVGAALVLLVGDADDGLARRARKVRAQFLRHRAA